MNSVLKHTEFQEDALKSYFAQIKQTPLLSHEEEISLSKRVMKGDRQAEATLIEANLRLVVKIAKHYVSPEFGLLDVIQEGNLGLLKAAEKYDYRKDVRFSTYAAWWIKQSITRALSNKKRPIRLPHRKEDSLRRIQKSFQNLGHQLARKPSFDEVAEDTGMKKQDVIDILTIASPTVSLDIEINDDSGTIYDVCEDVTYTPDSQYLKKAVREETLKVLEQLKEKEKKVIMYRFAFHGGKKYTLKRISDEMGISPETVRQIEMRAISKLKECASGLKEYMFN